MNRKLHYFIRVSVVAATALVLLAACGGDDKDKDEDVAKIPVTVQLSWYHEAEFAGVYAAIDQGYYAREGLEITAVPGGFDDSGAYIDPIRLIMDGTADFGFSSGHNVLLARQNGDQIVIFAQVFQRSPRVFISLAEKNITTPQDFVGKRVARRGSMSAVQSAFYSNAGIDAADVTEITDSALMNTTALINDEIDVIPGFITSESIELQLGGHAINNVVLSDYGIEDFQNLLVASQATIDDNPELVEKFLRATIDGLQFVLDNPEKAAEITHKYAADVDMDFLSASVLATIPLIQIMNTPVGTIDVPSWDPLVQILIDDGALADASSSTGAYTLEFLDKVNAAD